MSMSSHHLEVSTSEGGGKALVNACKLRKHNWRLSPIPDERSAQVAMCDVAPPMLGQARN